MASSTDSGVQSWRNSNPPLDDIIINKRDGSGLTALHWAAMTNDVPRIRLLLVNGADVNATKRTESSDPIMNMFQTLFNPRNLLGGSRETGQGPTPLHLAVLGYQFDAMEALLEAGADLNFMADMSKTETLTPFLVACDKKYEALAAYLLQDRGADPQSKDNLGNNVLHYAAAHGMTELLQIAIEAGAENNANTSGKLPLQFAAENGQLDAFKMLLESFDTNIDVADSKGVTPLLLAASGAHEGVFNFCLENGANAGVFSNTTSFGDHSFFESTLSGYSNHGNLLHFAARGGNISIFKKAMELGVEFCPNEKNWTPVHFAARFDHAEMLEFLIETFSIDVNECVATDAHPNEIPSHLLRIACKHESYKSIPLLLKAGADVNLGADDDCRTAISVLCDVSGAGESPGFKKAFDLLLEHGADVNQLSGGWAPLHQACRHDRAPIVKLLCEYGADPSIHDSEGRTPLEVALDNYDDCRGAIICTADTGLHNPGYRKEFVDLVLPLIKAGDHNWENMRAYDTTWPGLEKAVVAVFKKAPEKLPELFELMTPESKEVIRTILLCVYHQFGRLDNEARMSLVETALED